MTKYAELSKLSGQWTKAIYDGMSAANKAAMSFRFQYAQYLETEARNLKFFGVTPSGERTTPEELSDYPQTLLTDDGFFAFGICLQLNSGERYSAKEYVHLSVLKKGEKYVYRFDNREFSVTREEPPVQLFDLLFSRSKETYATQLGDQSTPVGFLHSFVPIGSPTVQPEN